MRFLLSLLLSFSSVCCLAQFRSPDLDDLGRSEVELALKEHVGYLSSAMLEGRAAGSEGELMAAQYVSSVLESYGIDVLSGSDGEMFGLRGNGGDTLRSRNVIAYIPGYDEDLRDRFIVIGARLDNLYPIKQNDSSVIPTLIYITEDGRKLFGKDAESYIANSYKCRSECAC